MPFRIPQKKKDDIFSKPPPPMTDPQLIAIRERLCQVTMFVAATLPLARNFVNQQFVESLRQSIAYYQDQIPGLYEDCMKCINADLVDNGVENVVAMVQFVNRRLNIGNMMEEGLLTGALKGLKYIGGETYNKMPLVIEQCRAVMNQPLPKSNKVVAAAKPAQPAPQKPQPTQQPNTQGVRVVSRNAPR